MRRATTRTGWMVLALIATQASADADWVDWSIENVCSISTTIRDAEDSAEIVLWWNRSPKFAPSVFIMQPTWAPAVGGDLAIHSPALTGPLVLGGTDGRGAGGAGVDVLMNDVAASTNWYLVRHLPDGSERRMSPDVVAGKKLAAMFGACRRIVERPAAPAPIDGQVRPRAMSVVELRDRCELNAHYRTGGADLGLTLVREKSSASIRASYPDLPPRLDLRSLGRRADESVSWDAPVTLDNVLAGRLIGDLVAGRERLLGRQTGAGTGDMLVFGGPEFNVEAAMFKACIDAL